MTSDFQKLGAQDARRTWSQTFAALVWLVCVLGARGQEVETTFDASGLTSLRYQGHEFLRPTGFFVTPTFLLPDGSRAEVPGQPALVFDAALQRQTYTYSWGTIVLTYEMAGARLNLRVAITNATANPLVQIGVPLLTVRFPSRPAGYAWEHMYEVSGLNIDDLTALPADYGTGLLLLCNDRPGVPLNFGFTAPLGEDYLIRMTTEVKGSPAGLEIAPGATREEAFSLRFAPAGTVAESLAGDLQAALAAQMPRELAWVDRRAIGTLFLASGGHASPTNPRGWLNDPALNTMTTAGLADFHQQMLAKADDCIARLKTMNAQGMIFWNVEGEEFSHLVYVGDPRRLGDLAPEMNSVADRFFAKFRAAGLRTGVCLRPSRIVPGFVPGHAWDHDNANFDVLDELSAKITYVQQRWGCTLIYIDSNVDYAFDGAGNFTARLLRAALMRDLVRQHPGVLIIPELPRTQYWAATAPYREVRGGYTATPALTRAVYPEAFTIIEPKDVDLAGCRAALVAAVRAGDILLFRAWFDEATNATIKSIYDEAQQRPVLTGPESAAADVGAPFSYTITDDQTATAFTASGLPPGLVLGENGVIAGTPLTSGDFTVTVAATSPGGTVERTVQLSLRTVLERWRAQYSFSGEDPAAALLANADGDAFCNLEEFAFGLNPRAADPLSLGPQVGILTMEEASWLALTFRRRTSVPRGVGYAVEESPDLIDWALLDPAEHQVGPAIDQADGTELVTIRGSWPLAAGQAFLRLRVSEE